MVLFDFSPPPPSNLPRLKKAYLTEWRRLLRTKSLFDFYRLHEGSVIDESQFHTQGEVLTATG